MDLGFFNVSFGHTPMLLKKNQDNVKRWIVGEAFDELQNAENWIFKSQDSIRTGTIEELYYQKES